MQKGIDIHVPAEGAILDVLVENCGRINYGYLTGKDAKGLPGGMLAWNAYLFDWENRSLPMDNLDKLKFGKVQTNMEVPTFFKGEFEVDEIAETFIKFPGVRGVIWVNGFNLGRYWNAGSAQTLYLPSPILKKGRNEIIVFETEVLITPYAESVDTAIM
jgi:beta-galactosidase